MNIKKNMPKYIFSMKIDESKYLIDTSCPYCKSPPQLSVNNYKLHLESCKEFLSKLPCRYELCYKMDWIGNPLRVEVTSEGKPQYCSLECSVKDQGGRRSFKTIKI